LGTVYINKYTVPDELRNLGGYTVRKIIIIGLAAAALFFAFGCGKDMESLEKGDPGAPNRVLIAGTASEFKQDVVERMIRELGTKDYYFKIIGLSRLDKENIDEYGSVLLVAMYAAGRLDERVTRFLQDDPTNPKAIVFYTVGAESGDRPEWATPDIRVDAVTSASVPDLVNRRADELVMLVKERFTTR
jgi:hypothetical protein